MNSRGGYARAYAGLSQQEEEVVLATVKELSFQKSIKVGDVTLTAHANVWRAADQRWSKADIEKRIQTARMLVNETLKAEVYDMKKSATEREIDEKLLARRDAKLEWEEFGLY